MGNNNKKSVIFLPLIVATIAVGSYFAGKFLNSGSGNDKDLYEKINSLKSFMPTSKFGQILSLIDESYVDTVDVDTLTEQYIEEMLHKLDPHSAYIPAKDAEESNEHLQGEFDGIGVMFNMATDTVIVQTVISGGPAEKVGVLGGDRIIMIGDSIVAGKKVNQNDIVKQLKGKGGTIVKVGIERYGVDDLLFFDIVRDKIPIKSVDAAFMIAPKVGYIKLLQFARTTHTEFIKAVKELEAQGMKKLIFDLAGNSGGYLDQAILIANEFLPKGKMIVYTQGRNSKLAEQYSDGRGLFQNQDLVVMVDEGSASSSEIVAGALQDNDRGTIIGRRTFGKGLVQQQIPFTDGSLLNLTIARYHTPTGRCIQRPYDKGYEEYYKDFFSRYVRSELVNQDSIKLSDSLKYTTPKGKVVYGGGGIMPDIFVPIDTTQFSEATRDIMIDNTLFYFTIRYADTHRSTLSGIKEMNDLFAFYEKENENIYKEFLAFARSKGKNPRLSDRDKDIIMDYMRAYISRNSGVSDNGFYYYFNRLDAIYLKAIEITKDNKTEE